MKKELAAVIIENRPLPNLIEIIKDHLSFLPDYTKLYVFGGIAVEQMIIDSGLECNFIEMNGVINEAEYNKLLTSFSFWNCIEEENVLIFQHDSKLLRKGIEDFYQYDYVGAPWLFCKHGGNGGLSFRNKKAMIEVIIERPNYNQQSHGNEDVFFCNRLEKYMHANLAPRNVCEQFSCESIFKLSTLGCHAIEKHLSRSECEQILNQYNKKETL